MAKAFKDAVKYCSTIGLKHMTVYAFSTENWKRPANEVNALMDLLCDYLDEFIKNHEDYKSRFVFISDLSPPSPALKQKIAEAERINADSPRIINIALNYGGRAEMVHAFNTLIKEGKTAVTEEDIASVVYTRESGDPDMIVRTGGDLRISNFRLWQSAYAELYFTDTLWPDLTPEDVDEAIRVFYSRKRRYGGL
jgi:undecaprenyl diphosphate synthase